MRSGALGCPSRLQPSHHRQPPGGRHWNPTLLVFGQQPVGAQRDRHVVAAPDLHAEKGRRRYADHGNRMAVETHSMPQDSRVASEFSLPEGITEHCCRVARLVVIMRGECAAQQRNYSEVAKEISADVKAFGKSRFAAVSEIEARRAPCQDARERLLL